MSARTILHVDMDAFYASIEQRDDPALAGKPLVVGGETRGVVAAASYEARRYGIRSAMPVTEARRRCPGLLRVKPRMNVYRDESRRVFAVFGEFTPLVEGLSLDEAFLDVSACRRLFGDGRDIGIRVKARIREKTGLTASVGVAWNKLVAKIASDLEKPDGLVVIDQEECQPKLDPLPVAVLPGIGPETLSRLQRAGIDTVGALRRADDGALEPIFGRYAARTRARAAGIDDRPVVPDRDGKSISAERTFDTDLEARTDLERELLRLTERTSRRMRKGGLVAGTLRLKIRQSDFTTVTRQRALRPPAAGTSDLYRVARELLSDYLAANAGVRIRLLGVGGADLAAAGQADLFGDLGAAPGRVDAAVDAVRDRFGELSVARARSLGKPDD